MPIDATTVQHYAGADWMEHEARRTLSPFGRKVADLLGDVFLGIYHISGEVLHKRVDWSNERWIQVVIHGSLSTFDDSGLTYLVLLAHERCIRVQVEGAANGYLRISFHPRVRGGDLTVRHPTIEAAIETVRQHFTREEPPKPRHSEARLDAIVDGIRKA